MITYYGPAPAAVRAGEAGSRWEKTESGIKYTVTIPANCTAEIRLPGGRTENVTAGKYEF